MAEEMNQAAAAMQGPPPRGPKYHTAAHWVRLMVRTPISDRNRQALIQVFAQVLDQEAQQPAGFNDILGVFVRMMTRFGYELAQIDMLLAAAGARTRVR
jgi:hypothetical protein